MPEIRIRAESQIRIEVWVAIRLVKMMANTVNYVLACSELCDHLPNGRKMASGRLLFLTQ